MGLGEDTGVQEGYIHVILGAHYTYKILRAIEVLRLHL
jgi:hypothetical protein